ncbi:hypothetical protein PBRA_008432 [Plasmodiophora brassicae]|uniref:Maspardin n=1 Tax=Plasmodiophora brassicae TaxID=37360 RepID=A0A0G4J0Q3_PLABS|nr:hypothetical protein PBRA_008432 [Plasmodiophora brassicae]
MAVLRRRRGQSARTGIRQQVPLLCVPGTTTSAEAFFVVHNALCDAGYRVLSLDYPGASSGREWAVNLLEFLDYVHIDKVHIFGLELGGHLALWFACTFPERVASLILCQAFLSTTPTPLRSTFPLLPAFVLRRHVSKSPHSAGADARVADAVAFAAALLDAMPRDDVLSRLLLRSSPIALPGLEELSSIAITNLRAASPSSPTQQECAEVLGALPRCRSVDMDVEGDLPILSCPDDVLRHVRQHLDAFPNTCSTDEGRDVTAAAVPPAASSPSLLLFDRNAFTAHPRILSEDAARAEQRPAVVVPVPAPAPVVRKRVNDERERRKQELFRRSTARSHDATLESVFD